MPEDPPSLDAFRFTYVFEGAQIQRVAADPVAMIPPPSQPILPGPLAGFWYEVTNAAREPLWRRMGAHPLGPTARLLRQPASARLADGRMVRWMGGGSAWAAARARAVSRSTRRCPGARAVAEVGGVRSAGQCGRPPGDPGPGRLRRAARMTRGLYSSGRSAVLALVLAAGCVSVSLDVTFAPGSIDMRSPGTTVLQDPAQRPVHVGDGGADVESIPAEYRLAHPSHGRGWRIVVDRPPGAAELEATIESLAPVDDPSGCSAEAVLNDRPVARLQAPRGAAPGAISVVKVPLPAGVLRVGENRLEIVQRECAVTRGQDRFDDALIRSVLLRVP